jgi:uncharacterized protein YacL
MKINLYTITLTFIAVALGLSFSAYAEPVSAQNVDFSHLDSGALDRLPLWAIFVITLLVVFLSIEIGFRLANAVRRRSEYEQKWPLEEIVGATLGLLAFMLAFTLGMAASRFDRRRSLVLDEANAMGSTHLRARFLPEPNRTEVRNLLREYLDVRLNAPRSGKIAEAIAKSGELQDRLWSKAVAVGEKNPGSVVVGLFIASLSDLIDLHTKRVAQVQNRILEPIWIAPYVVSSFAMSTVGYHAGLTTTRRFLSTIPLAITFSVVIMLITDLDRPHEGVVRESQQPLIHLQNSWNGRGS